MASVQISRTDMLAIVAHLEDRYSLLRQLAPQSTLYANRARILGNLIAKLRHKLTAL